MIDVSEADIRRAAMDLLARREHSRHELIRKLQRKLQAKCPDLSESMLEAQVDRLRDEGLQSDARMAEMMIRSRVNRGQGPVKIEAELRAKGVDPGVVADALESCDVDWFILAREVARKRFGPDKPADARERAKRVRFLQQRGFSFEHISALD